MSWSTPIARLLPRLLLAALILHGPAALAVDPGTAEDAVAGSMCADAQDLDRYRLLRRLSLDLRNRLPAYDEYLALDVEPDVPADTIAAYLASDDFRVAMRRFHESLFWPNISGVQLNGTNLRLIEDKRGIWYVRAAGKQKSYRGDSDTACGDWEQTEFSPLDGAPIPVESTTDDGTPIQLDGWVEVAPYWAPDAAIKVCAFDAQQTEVAKIGPAQVECATTKGQGNPKCGCGPALRTCYGDDAMSRVRDAMTEQLLRLVDDVVVGGYPYSDLVTTPRVHMNGTLDHFKRWLSPIFNPTKTMDVYTEADGPLPESPIFTDGDTWEVRERLHPHAGIQTLPAFTLRFQTNRGRANRFRVVFTDQYFVPSSGASDESACDPIADDLTQRCVCQDCHVVLEPLAAYFAPIAEAGSGDVSAVPSYEAACVPASEGDEVPKSCGRFYVTEFGAYNVGTLRTHQYADVADPVHEAIGAHIELGPAGFAESVLSTGLFHSSMVRHLWRQLMGRDLNTDASDPANELGLLDELTTEFEGTDDFRTLVERLVTLPQYRRVR